MKASCLPTMAVVFKATISGGRAINVYLNKNDGKGDQLIVTGTDPTFTDGGPSIRIFIDGSIDPSELGFASFKASSY